MKEYISACRLKGESVAFVPTMGYLHEGHLSLAERARAENDRVVMSIFVNPIQFGPKEDLGTYPRDLGRDMELAEACGVDCIFAPAVDEMYPPGYVTYVEPVELADRLCGASRPGHFRGVCTVVLKLFHIVKADRAYFGQKDAQQLIILRRMAADLNLDIELIGVPIKREADGLAMSSRNVYLNAEERAEAVILYRSIRLAEAMYAAGERDVAKIRTAMLAKINEAQLARIDYLEIVDPMNLNPLTTIEGEALAAMAVFFGKTRLIDNTFL
jgi:pantoate--beta-alanine ligase